MIGVDFGASFVKKEFADMVKDPAKKALRLTVEMGRAHALRILRDNDAWDVGTLARSIEPDYSKIEELEARLFTNAPHAAVVEFGAGPSGETPTPGWWAPIEPLYAWARRRLGLKDREARSAAYAIQHAIHERGIAPRPYMRPTADYMRRVFPEELRKAEQKALKKRRETKG